MMVVIDLFFFFFDHEPYIAIIGDIIGSKEIKERNQIQKKLYKTLCDINEKYSDSIASKFMITLGDEFQGLLKAGADMINIMDYIEIKMHPVQIRFGIGIGEITTEINPDAPFGADGPAYYHARSMIDTLKASEKKKKSITANVMIASDSNASTDILLNSILTLCAFVKSKWTNRQREVIYDCIENGDNQVQAAKRLGITQSSVQKNLSNSGYYTYKNSMELIIKAFSEIKGRQYV